MKNYVILSLCLMFFVFNANAKNVSRSSQNGSDSTFIDYLHPRNFVRIYEKDMKEDSYVISSPYICTDSSGSKKQKLKHEVDINSRIYLEIDKGKLYELMINKKFLEIDLSVEGHIGNREFEIPGYSMIGEEKMSITSRLHSGREFFISLATIDDYYKTFFDKWNDIHESVEKQYLRNDYETEQDERLKTLMGKIKDCYDQYGDELIKNPNKYNLNLTQYNIMLEKLNIARQSSIYRSKFGKLEGKQLADLIDRYSSRLSILLKNIYEPQDQMIIKIIMNILKSDVKIYQNTAKTLDSKYLPIMVQLSKKTSINEGEVDEIYGTWQIIREEMNSLLKIDELILATEENTNSEKKWDWVNIVESFDNYLAPKINNELVRMMKESNFLVAQAGAKVGDVIIIDIINHRDDPTMCRSYTVKIDVKEFGLIKNVNDSFLFIHRNDVTKKQNEKFIQEKIKEVKTSKEASKITIQGPSLFEPAPGATFGWVWKPRGEKSFSTFFRWLQPGFGINVSTPTFRSTEYSIEPNLADTLSFDPIISIVESEDNIQFGVGVMASLWDGTVQFTYGKNMSFPEKNEYYALGFSFISVIKKVKIVMTKD